jgi:hypothetical protein
MAGERHGRGMASVNQTRPHCVNQMGKTRSKPLAVRHGRGTACYVWIGLKPPGTLWATMGLLRDPFTLHWRVYLMQGRYFILVLLSTFFDISIKLGICDLHLLSICEFHLDQFMICYTLTLFFVWQRNWSFPPKRCFLRIVLLFLMEDIWQY